MNAYKILLKDNISDYLRKTRQERMLTQEDMASALLITPRAYGDLERGKYCASALVLLCLICSQAKQDPQLAFQLLANVAEELQELYLALNHEGSQSQ